MSPRDYGPSAPKPYDFVEIKPLGSKDRQRPAGHDRYQPGTVSGRLEATLIVATPLHVSSGRLKMRRGKEPRLVREMTRINGQPCVPASTLKGMVRSVVEAVTRSCIRITDAHKKGGKWQRYRLKHPLGSEGCLDPDSLCIACQMFGALGFEGNVRLGDAILGTGRLGIVRMPSLWEPAKKGADPYLRGNHPSGRKFYKHGQSITRADTPVEVLLPESRLELAVRFENLTPGQLGVLLTALGVGEPSLILKLGGGKPACYGSVAVRLEGLQVWGNPLKLYADYQIEPTSMALDEYLQSAVEENLLLPEQLQDLAGIWVYDMGRHCPEGNY